MSWSMKTTYAQIYPINVDILPFNAVNGEPMQTLSYGQQRHNPRRTSSKSTLPNIQVGFTTGEEGLELRLRGVAAQPLELVIRSEGFKDLAITIDEETEGRLRVAMEPVEIEAVAPAPFSDENGP